MKDDDDWFWRGMYVMLAVLIAFTVTMLTCGNPSFSLLGIASTPTHGPLPPSQRIEVVIVTPTK